MFDQALVLPATFWILAAIATFLVGMSKAGFGGAATNLAVPILAIVVTPPVAAAVLLPLLLVFDAIGLVVFKGRGDGPNLRILLPGAMLGVALGWLVFDLMDARWIRVLIGIEAVLFAIDRLREGRRVEPSVATRPGRGRGLLWGAVSGFTSFISHAGGPPVMQFLMPQRMDKMRFIGTTAVYFAIVNAVKLVPYGQLGLLDLSNLAISALLLPVVPLGYLAGYRLLKAIDLNQFNLLVAWLLLATGGKLLWDGLT